jgi:hypothetical protein
MIVARQNSTNSDFKLPPAGSFSARLYRLIDIGTQTTEWMGKKKMQRKLRLKNWANQKVLTI